MVTDEYVEGWKRIEKHDDIDRFFPEFFVSQPPHRDTLTPVYYKVMSPRGPVFWRREGDDTGRETTFYDMMMEEKNGFGVQKVGKEYTPWSDD
jgi:hypothetical protein